jgi:hypothetical protein
MLSVAFYYCHAECHNAECRNAECHYTKCHYVECRGAQNYAFTCLGSPSGNPISCPLSKETRQVQPQLLVLAFSLMTNRPCKRSLGLGHEVYYS